MLGAIIGDIIGSIYEWDPYKSTEFPLFSDNCIPTDDSMMTAAVAQALMDTYGKSDEEILQALIRCMKSWGLLYPGAGYGASFNAWLRSDGTEPYNSFGNGSAMRVSSVGWLYPTLEETLHMAKLTADVTHNHPEGEKGAMAVAAAIFMARNGSSKEEIKEYIEKTFGYDLNREVGLIRLFYQFDVSCQGSVPEAIICFLEGNSFEEAVRLAVSLGGDADTQAAIAGSIAEAFYGIPDEIVSAAQHFIPEPMKEQVERFNKFKLNKAL